MSFNLEEFKVALDQFGTLSYSLILPIQGEESSSLEFSVDNVKYLYAISNFGEFCKTQILPYYPNLIVLSIDKKKF